MKKQALKFAPGITVVALLSCTATGNTGKGKTVPSAITMTTTTATAQQEPRESGTVAGGTVMVATKSIMDNTAGARDLATLTAALKASGLDSLLKSKGPFTIFAPDNEAFNELPAGTVDNLLKPERKKDLHHILACHIVAGAYTADNLSHVAELKTLQGGRLKIRHKDDVWWVNNARVIGPHANSSNGTLWIINKVLLPGKPGSYLKRPEIKRKHYL